MSYLKQIARQTRAPFRARRGPVWAHEDRWAAQEVIAETPAAAPITPAPGAGVSQHRGGAESGVTRVEIPERPAPMAVRPAASQRQDFVTDTGTSFELQGDPADSTPARGVRPAFVPPEPVVFETRAARDEAVEVTPARNVESTETEAPSPGAANRAVYQMPGLHSAAGKTVSDARDLASFMERIEALRTAAMQRRGVEAARREGQSEANAEATRATPVPSGLHPELDLFPALVRREAPEPERVQVLTPRLQPDSKPGAGTIFRPEPETGERSRAAQGTPAPAVEVNIGSIVVRMEPEPVTQPRAMRETQAPVNRQAVDLGSRWMRSFLDR